MSRIEELEKRLAADPNSRIFVQLAEEYRKQGLLENAIEICEAGLVKHPHYPSARVALGRALLEAESFDRASEEFEAVLAQVPDNILANKFLGETYHKLGRYDEAIQKYQIARTLAPEDAELEGKIDAVRSDMAGGGPPAAAPPADIGDETAPADPGEYVSAPPTEAPLEPTLVDGPPPESEPVDTAAPTQILSTIPQPEGPVDEAGAEPEPAEPKESLAPIPLVDVDGPMELEGPSYNTPAEEAPSNVSSEPIPLVTDPFQPSGIEPPPVPPPAMEPPPMEPPPVQPPPVQPPPVQPPTVQPPPMAPPAVEPPPMAPPTVEPIMAEPMPVEPLPVEPIPVVEAPAEPPAPAGAPPRTAASPPAPEVPAVDEEIETPTMAELYASQGHFDKAVNVYRNLLVRQPNETQYVDRIEELEMLAQATADGGAPAMPARAQAVDDGLSVSGRDKTIQVLENWLDAIRRSRRT